MEPEERFDPAAALAVVQSQQRDVSRRMARLVPWILLAWAVAWGVGFTALWLIDGIRPGLPWQAGAAIFIVLNVLALVASGVLGGLSSRGIRSSKQAAFTGAVYGITWMVGFIAIFALGGALVSNGMDPALSNIYYPTASAVFVGVMYLVGGAIWQLPSLVVLGAWFALVGIVAPYFGYPGNYLFFAIAGGGGFLIGAIVAAIWVAGGHGERVSPRG